MKLSNSSLYSLLHRDRAGRLCATSPDDHSILAKSSSAGVSLSGQMISAVDPDSASDLRLPGDSAQARVCKRTEIALCDLGQGVIYDLLRVPRPIWLFASPAALGELLNIPHVVCEISVLSWHSRCALLFRLGASSEHK